jgi:hypothetical protein
MCADLMEKLILLLVIYFPPVSFLYEEYIPTISYNIDYFVGRFIFGITTMVYLKSQKQKMCLESQQLKICLELQRLDGVAT